MAQEVIQLRPIEAISPTLAETLRLCKLQAGLSRAEGASQYVLGNPKAWLGTAYHEVLAAAGQYNGADLDQVITGAWKSAIEREDQKAKSHPLNSRFGAPETWPGYHLIAAMGRLRAQELADRKPRSPGTREGAADGVAGIHREEKFTGVAGKIVGRPDVVCPEEVIDFKSGTLLDDESPDQIKPSYVRQLRLYAFLVKEALGWWPRRGVLLPMIGSPVEIDLEPGECEKEAEDAVRLLEEYNAAIARAPDPGDLANPSPSSCRWCPYQLYCPAFWSLVAPDWGDDLRSGVVVGSATGAVQPIYGGSALSLSLRVERGTVPAGEFVSLFPLDASAHDSVVQVQAGDQVRVTGLWRRADSSVVPTIRTVLTLESNVSHIIANRA